MTGSTKVRTLASTLLILSLFTLISSSSQAAVGVSVGSFSPTRAGAGATVIINGTGFTSGMGVTFNNTASTGVTFMSSTQIKATVPATASTGFIKVGTSPASTAQFAFVSPPTITSFTPAAGNLSTTIEITAENLFDNPSIKINGTLAEIVTNWNSSTKVVKVHPGIGSSTGRITVTTSGGSGAAAWGYTATTGSNFSIYSSPTITSFTPVTVIAGTSVTVTGTNFVSGSTAVSFGSTEAVSVHWTSATQVEATVPSNATSDFIKVSTPGGDVTSSYGYTFYSTPTITGFTPTTLGVGTQVTITGTNLTGLSEVKFGGITATVDSSDNTTIRTTVPDGVNVNGTITAKTPGGTATSGQYTYSAGPTFTSFAPTSLNAGTIVTIKGLALGTTTGVLFNGVPGTIISATATQVIVTAPAGTSSGLITINTSEGTATSISSFIYYGTSTPIKTTCPVLVPTTTIKTTITLGSCTVLTKVALPTISGFTSISGAPLTSTAKNTKILIVGTNLTGTSSIKFHGVATSGFTVNSPTQITVTVPVTATSGTVSVTTAGGTVNSSGTLTITA